VADYAAEYALMVESFREGRKLSEHEMISFARNPELRWRERQDKIFGKPPLIDEAYLGFSPHGRVMVEVKRYFQHKKRNSIHSWVRAAQLSLFYSGRTRMQDIYYRGECTIEFRDGKPQEPRFSYVGNADAPVICDSVLSQVRIYSYDEDDGWGCLLREGV
jgi:hypothetical protein